MKKSVKFITTISVIVLVGVSLVYNGCKKAQLQQTGSDYATLIAAAQYTNSQLIHFIKLTDPPLNDRELMGIMIAASPLDDNIIKELLKRGQPPCRCALSDETLQMILLFNLPLSDHILKELDKYDIKLSRSLLENIHLTDLPDMELDKANLLMESLLNLKFGDGTREFHKIERVTSTFQVQGTLQSGRYFVLAQEFIEIIDQMRLRCTSDEGSVTTPCVSKHIRAVDLEIKTSIDPITGNKVFDVNLTTIVALELAQPAGPKCFFGSNEYWKAYGAPPFFPCTGGICAGPNVGQYPCDDAAEQIEMMINTGLSTTYCDIPQPSCQFFTGIEERVRTGGNPDIINTNDPVQEDNKYDFLLFFSTGDPSWGPTAMANHHDCLGGDADLYWPQYPNVERNELEFYRKGALTAAQIVKPAGKEFFSIAMHGWYYDWGTHDDSYNIMYAYYATPCGLPPLD